MTLASLMTYPNRGHGRSWAYSSLVVALALAFACGESGHGESDGNGPAGRGPAGASSGMATGATGGTEAGRAGAGNAGPGAGQSGMATALAGDGGGGMTSVGGDAGHSSNDGGLGGGGTGARAGAGAGGTGGAGQAGIVGSMGGRVCSLRPPVDTDPRCGDEIGAAGESSCPELGLICHRSMALGDPCYQDWSVTAYLCCDEGWVASHATVGSPVVSCLEANQDAECPRAIENGSCTRDGLLCSYLYTNASATVPAQTLCCDGMWQRVACADPGDCACP